MMLKYVLIALGGGLGAVLRYVVAGWGQRLGEGVFPLGTLIVNVSGCLLIGVAAGLLAGPAIVRDEVRLALLVGFLGGFTTFSTFGLETFALLGDREWWHAAVYVGASNVLGIACVFVGYRVAVAVQGT